MNGTEMINAQQRTWVVLVMSILGISPRDPDIIIGAFAGSIIFVASAIDFVIWVRVMLFTASIFIGITTSAFTAQVLSLIISKFLSANIQVPPALGAAISSAAAVRLLMYLSMKPKRVFSVFDKLKRNQK